MVSFFFFKIKIKLHSTTKDILEPGNLNITKKCEVPFKLNTTYPAPVHVYYEISGYFLNHIELVKSKDFAQLRGEKVSTSTLESSCKGMVYNKDAFGNDTNKLVSWNGEPLDPDAPMSPCGKIARNYFHDNYTLYSSVKKVLKRISINETGIADDSDRKISIKRSADSEATQWIDVTNEHFMVWMHMESFPTFKKLWGKIEVDLTPGDYMIHIENSWDVSQNQAEKYFVISSSQGLGSASFFGWCLIKAAFICACSVVILFITKVTQKHTFDESDLTWD
jgi:hypothetical protein